MIWVMSLAMLKMDRARAKWAYKLSQVFDKRNKAHDTSGKASKYALLILPLVTVMREGLEAVVFIGGVSLGIEARSIPIACIVGLITGCAVGAVIYFSSMKMNLRCVAPIVSCRVEGRHADELRFVQLLLDLLYDLLALCRCRSLLSCGRLLRHLCVQHRVSVFASGASSIR